MKIEFFTEVKHKKMSPVLPSRNSGDDQLSNNPLLVDP